MEIQDVVASIPWRLVRDNLDALEQACRAELAALPPGA